MRYSSAVCQISGDDEREIDQVESVLEEDLRLNSAKDIGVEELNFLFENFQNYSHESMMISNRLMNRMTEVGQEMRGEA